MTYTVLMPGEQPIAASARIEPVADGSWHIRFESHDARSGRAVHRFDAVSFRYYGPYLYLHDSADKLVGTL